MNSIFADGLNLISHSPYFGQAVRNSIPRPEGSTPANYTPDKGVGVMQSHQGIFMGSCKLYTTLALMAREFKYTHIYTSLYRTYYYILRPRGIK
jgi:hypothetical protein